MAAYYNEIDPYAAQWLRNLIQAGHIAEGIVDERSIEDVKPSDLSGFTQVHFFAGIGVWSHALRQAGWSDDRPVWTGSCPCQPFSPAGPGSGFADERHLWPAFFHLIEQCKPATVFGEQVASKDAEPWLDLVQTDLEAVGYAVGAVAFPSASVGAPHIRDRLYWVADSKGKGKHGASGNTEQACAEKLREEQERHKHDCGCTACGMADTSCQRECTDEPRSDSRNRKQLVRTEPGCDRGHDGADAQGRTTASTTNGFWRDSDWLLCRDGKWRPVEPGTFPLAHGAAARVGRLRAYGNAINAKAAQAFIESFLES